MSFRSPVCCLLFFSTSLLLWSFGTTDAYAELPRDHEFQQVLGDHLATLTENDLEVELEPLEYEASWFTDNDRRHRTHLLLRNQGRWMPSADGLRLPAENFTLDAIEDGDNVRMGYDYVNPADIAWWAGWDYPGNPYYEHPGVQNRAFVAAAVELIMVRRALEEGSDRYSRHDHLGGTLQWMAYSYAVVKESLPDQVQSAYEDGLRYYFSHLEEVGPTGIHADMDTFSTVSMWYTADAIDDPNLTTRYEEHVDALLDRHFYPAGFVDHGDGFDASYNGISLFFLTQSALASEYQPIVDAADQMYTLRAHLSLPEPSGERAFYGPTHFATTMSPDSFSDQRQHGGQRNILGAHFADDARYLVMLPPRADYHGDPLPDVEQMEEDIETYLGKQNDRILEPIDDSPPEDWSFNHWGEVGHLSDYAGDGFYDEVQSWIEDEDPRLVNPFERASTFVRSFPEPDPELDDDFRDTFLVTRQNGYAAIVHTGRLSWWDQPISGLGGGALSAFWTEDTGSVIMGRARNRPYDENDRDSWDNWKIWQTHAISGATEDGNAFSSARNRFPDKTYRLLDADGGEVDNSDEAVEAVVETGGTIGADYDDGHTTEDGNVTGDVEYTRTFEVSRDSLTVESTLSSDESDTVEELYETIPVFLGEDHDEDQGDSGPNTSVHFLAGGEWAEADTAPREDVEEIRIDRYDGSVFIAFERPRRVQMAPEPSYYSHNILVDLLESGGEPVAMPEETSVSYTIESPCEDGETRSCYSGPSQTEGVGECSTGTRTCVDGAWTEECEGDITPATEICDSGLDESCTGAVDDCGDGENNADDGGDSESSAGCGCSSTTGGGLPWSIALLFAIIATRVRRSRLESPSH